ncbi:MAG TPA: cytochrome c [Candidatus Lustribacter sp.]|jgi:mono/diheme cytochrome c family protein|nr:cytochrome c [Candidatus Lustribacter sp.]
MKLTRSLLLLIPALIVAAALTTNSLSAQGGGVYTADQATAGKAIFDAQCSLCHGSNLEGSSGPQLAGPDFIGKWSGQTADDLRDFIATQMPLTAPGSLKPPQVLAVLSYILQKNKYPAGDSELTAASAKKVKIAKQG